MLLTSNLMLVFSCEQTNEQMELVEAKAYGTCTMVKFIQKIS